MVADFYWPFLGGVEQHVRTLSHALCDRGHQVTVATLWHEGLAACEEDQGVQVRRLRGSTQRAKWLFSEPKRPWSPPFPDPEITLGLHRLIRQARPDIVHGHDWLARSFWPLKDWSQAKTVMSLHYYTLSCAKKNLMRDDAPCDGPAWGKCMACGTRHYGAAKGAATVAANWGMAAWERRAVDLFISVSQATAIGNQLDTADVPQMVIPNFVPDTASSRTALSHTALSHTVDIEPYLAQLPQGPFLMFVGDLRPIKGVAVLLQAYAELTAAASGLGGQVPPLVLIGKQWADTPRDLPHNTYVLHDWPNEAVRAAWARSSIGLAPSLWHEPFGIVVIEAMAGGSPVIGSRMGGIPEIVVDGESGLLVPPGDAAALRAAMQRLIEDEGLRRKMGEAARCRAEQFTAAAVVPQIEAAYGQLLGH